MVPGFTLCICFGKYAGWGIVTNDIGYRLILGWVSFSLLPFDVEATVVKFLNEVNRELH